MFNEIKKESFVEREERILALWEEKKTFLQSIELNKDKPAYTFYDGPPFATGLPHYGHLLAGTIKDVVPRYKTMKGFHVPRRFGWDCHGLPIENEIEKLHSLSGAQSIKEFGIAKFNEECRKIVKRFSKEWKKTVLRMGRWVDFDQTYHTMDLPFMESVWWVFKQLHEKGLVYEGFKVMPFSAQLGTPLSNFEATSNYKDVDDPSLTVSLEVQSLPNTFILAWTTTPWTLPSNLALCVGPSIDYVTIQDHNNKKNYILAKDRLANYFKNEEEYSIIKTQKGAELAGLRYEPLLPYFAHFAENGAFTILAEEHVTTEDGTGVVHTAPAFGEDDFYACQKAGIPLACPVDDNGLFTEEVSDFKGIHVKEADKGIIKKLKAEGKVVHHGTIRHRYPFCWRSDTPLIYKAVASWFIAVEKIKPELLASNEKVHWTPAHIKKGRFGKWLEGARDWAVSRNRYWGTPIPIWRSNKGSLLVVGSIQELESLSGQKIKDLHRHHIDQITFEKDGETYERVSQVFDCWFESGSMPYAQNHYPFENNEYTEQNFPADFIAEGLDQTRGWFYTLTVLATALFKEPAFKNVVVNGIILAEDGNKMSKRLRNYPDPTELVNEFGADAIRLYMLHSPAVRAEDLRFCKKGVELVSRQILIPWWNAFSFFMTYARIYDWTPSSLPSRPSAAIDQWILSSLHQLIQEVEEGMDKYELSQAVEPFVRFIDQITNWYIRRSRRRFWSEIDSPDRQEAFQTLYTVLVNLSKIAAPFVPFLSEGIYQELKMETEPDSVHLCSFPSYDTSIRNIELEDSMKAVQTVVGLGHTLRKEHKLKVRQPLPAVHIASADSQTLSFLRKQKHLIEEELNVKDVVLHEDESSFVTLKAKPNFRVLGKKVGKLMKATQQTIAQFGKEELHTLQAGNTLAIQVEDRNILLTPEDVEVTREVKEGQVAINSDALTLMLDTSLDETLIEEGLAREIVNKINTMRRDAQLEVTDRIHVTIESSEKVKKSYSEHAEYIKSEVLAIDFTFKACNGIDWDLNGEEAKIEVVRA